VRVAGKNFFLTRTSFFFSRSDGVNQSTTGERQGMPHLPFRQTGTSDSFSQGNAAFKGGDYAVAIGLYTEAIQTKPDDPTFPLNRAAAYLKLDKYVPFVCQ
jgi:hypothetical protein